MKRRETGSRETPPASEPADGEARRADLARIPGRGHYSEQARLERLRWARRQSGAGLPWLETTSLPPERLTGNVENLIGGVEVPVGLAGPLLFDGQAVDGPVVAPFATTEGSLVASACRGATAVSRSGGVTTRVLGQRMIRAPYFVLSSLDAACRFSGWIRGRLDDLRAQVRRVSQHAELTHLEPLQIGKTIHLRFIYETADAAGQNMTTACTWQACQWILAQLEHQPGRVLESFYIDANLSGDKKVTYQSFLHGRGTRVTAECFLTGEVLEQVLKVTPEQMERCHRGILQGSIGAGAVGHNVNVANVVAAIYTATGQDIGCVHESSLGQLHLEASARGLYAAILLPGLIVGTVGGGTQLPIQEDLLDLMGCAGAGKGFRLAEIIAGFCLATDLSTMAAIASGSFAAAHQRLGRNHPVEWFTEDDLTPAFFESALRKSRGDPALAATGVEPLEVAMGSSILTELTARRVRKLVGLVPLRLRYRTAAGEPGEEKVLVKVKPLDEEVILMVHGMASMCGARLADLHCRHRDRTGFKGCHLRELAVYEQTAPGFVRHAPRVYRCFRDDAREAYVVVMELLEDLTLFDTADDVSGWRTVHVEAALEGIAAVHAIWLGRERELLAQPWLGPVMTAEVMVEMSELWEALAVHAAEEFGRWFCAGDLRRQQRIIASLPDWWAELETLPMTLIHNDFNPRNVAFRNLDGGGLRLCAYDWELATLHLPQRDLAELLSFVLTPDATAVEVDHLVENHRRALELASGRMLDAGQWRRGYGLALLDFAVNRAALYGMAHTFRNYGFMERMFRTLHRLIDLEGLG